MNLITKYKPALIVDLSPTNTSSRGEVLSLSVYVIFYIHSSDG